MDSVNEAFILPAALIGLSDTGRIAVGRAADLTLWSPRLEVTATIVGGDIAFSRA